MSNYFEASKCLHMQACKWEPKICTPCSFTLPFPLKQECPLGKSIIHCGYFLVWHLSWTFSDFPLCCLALQPSSCFKMRVKKCVRSLGCREEKPNGKVDNCSSLCVLCCLEPLWESWWRKFPCDLDQFFHWHGWEPTWCLSVYHVKEACAISTG